MKITNQEIITIALIISLVVWGYMFIRTSDCKTQYDYAVSHCEEYCNSNKYKPYEAQNLTEQADYAHYTSLNVI